nr:MAG TPA: hypothetical protein [Bacteriophage sp.]
MYRIRSCSSVACSSILLIYASKVSLFISMSLSFIVSAPFPGGWCL